MSTIKDKPLKKKHTDPRITIDVIHNDIISNFDNEDEENDYYLDNGLILSEYYNNGFTASTKKTNNKNNILDFFKSEDIDKDKDKEANKKTENIISTYLSKVDDEYINSNFEDTEDMMHICIQCKNSMIYKLQESEILCEYCGYTDKILMNNEKISYKETPREISYFAYKRINHFNE